MLTAIFTYPLIFTIKSNIAGAYTSDEPFAWLAYFWWLKYAFKHHLADMYYSVIAVPFGIDISKQILYPLWGFFSKWLTILTDNTVSFNIQVLSSFILSGITMFYLTFYLTKERLSSLFAGIVYAFCPYHFARVWQHISLAQIQWMPLYILSLIKLRELPNFKNMFLCILSMFLIISFEFHYAYFMYIATGLFLLYCFILSKKFDAGYTKLLKLAFLVMIISLVFTLPTSAFLGVKKVFFKKKSIQSSAWSVVRPFDDLFAQSARPLSYFLPSTAHPVFGKLTESFVGTSLYGESLTEHTLYLGWVPLVLAFVAVRKWKRSRNKGQSPKSGDSPCKDNFYIGFFVFLAIAAWFFSQPPWWQIGPIKIYMPSFFMYKILPMFRAYCRFGIVVMLAVAALAGFGLKFILERFKTQKAKVAISALFCGLVLFEFWNWPPYKVIDVSRVPAVYYWLKEQPKDIVIAEYPLDIIGPNEMYKFYQTKHEKKIINGTIPGTDAHKFAQTIIKLSDPKTAVALKRLGVKYVLVHKDGYLNTELTTDKEELEKIPKNSGLRFIQSFPVQECPQKDIMCVQKTGPIDVYEIIAPAAGNN